MQIIEIPITADKLIVKADGVGTNHAIEIESQDKNNRSNPKVVIEIRRKGSSQYETVMTYLVGVDELERFTASVEEYRFTFIDTHLAGFNRVTFKDTTTAGENDNANLDTEVIEGILAGDDYVGSNYSTLAELNSTRANPAAMSWALVADNGNGSPAIAVSNGVSYSILESGGGTNQDEVLLEGLASGFLYVNDMRAG